MKRSELHGAIAPRLLSREEAAAYCGVSANTFIAMVHAQEMPSSFNLVGRRIVWDVREIDTAIDEIKQKLRETPAANNDNGAKSSWDD